MVNGEFVKLSEIAEAAGCDYDTARTVAIHLLESLHKTALLNGVTGSLHEISLNVGVEAAYHLGGIYGAVGDEDAYGIVDESLARMGVNADDCRLSRERMQAWEKTLTEDQRSIIRNVRKR